MSPIRGVVPMVLAALLIGCTGGAAPVGDPVGDPGPLPPEPPLGRAIPAGTTAFSNRSLARLFAELTHGLEWGAARPGLVRLEPPVTVALEGAGSAAYGPFTERYLGFIARETGIPIRRIAAGSADIAIRFVGADDFARTVPEAGCVLVPGDVDWTRFREDPEGLGADAMEATLAQAATIFLPRNAPPHVTRSCLVEEIAQALGPANDIAGLGPSIFNDDGAHLWPTRLDLLMVRTLYQPELEAGMSREATGRAVSAALDRIHPEGRDAPDLHWRTDDAVAGWRDVSAGIFARDATPATRERQARDALAIVARRDPGGARHCQGLAALGRVLAPLRPAEALSVLDQAGAICAAAHGTGDIRLARLALEEATILLAGDHPDAALARSEGLDTTFAALGQDAALAALYALRAHAYRATGREAEAEQAGRLADEWSAYAFGTGATAPISLAKQ